MRINIAGDFVITEKYLQEDLFSSSIKQFFSKDSINIINLECPIIEDNFRPIVKSGPNLFTKKKIINYLKYTNINVVTLANNHIFDYGKEGLENTCKHLTRNEIKYVGVGNNLNKANIPLVLEEDSIKVGIINFCENEWSIADDENPGANPVNIIDNYKQISDLKTKVDHIIVIHHGGHELFEYPSPRMKKLFKFYVDIGADVVVNHHTHCISGYEYYKGKPIFYSLGNFLFTSDNVSDSWYEGLILSLDIKKNDMSFNLIPVTQDRLSHQVNICDSENKSKILTKIEAINNVINEDIELGWIFDQYLENNINRLKLFSPVNFVKPILFRRLLFKLKIDKIFNYDKFYLSFLNNLRCESHRDVLIKLIEKKVKHENSNS